jgi:hypothetical protein
LAARLPAGVVPLCTVQFVDVLGVTVVVTALPRMLTDLGASQSAAGPVVTAYAMFFGGLLVLGARCGDRFGHRRVLQGGIVLFGLASLLAALAPVVSVLVVARSLQGVAAALSVPAALRLLTAVAPEGDARRRSLALWSASGAAAGASGFVLGGFVTQWSSWRLIFWFTLVLAGVAAARRAGGAGRTGRSGAAPRRARGGGADGCRDGAGGRRGGAGVRCGARRRARRRRRRARAGARRGGAAARVPLLPGVAVRDRNLRAGSLGSFLNTATTGSAATLVTLHLQGIDRLSAVAAGLLLLPFSLAVVAAAGLAAPALWRWRPGVVMALGLGLIAVGTLALVPFDAAAAAVPFCVAVSGAGIGLSSVAATSVGTDVPAAVRGVASGVLNTAAQLGTALGVAGVLLVAAVAGGSGGPAAGAGRGWVCAGVLAVLGGVWVARVAGAGQLVTCSGQFRPGRPGGYPVRVGAGSRSVRS